MAKDKLEGLIPWDPLVVGAVADVHKAVSKSLEMATENGAPGAHKATFTTAATKVGSKDATKVEISGLDHASAEALWRDHLEPMTTQLLKKGG